MLGVRSLIWQDFSGQITYGQDFIERSLDLAIPHSGSAVQQQIISGVSEYATSKGVKLDITIIDKVTK